MGGYYEVPGSRLGDWENIKCCYLWCFFVLFFTMYYNLCIYLFICGEHKDEPQIEYL